MRYTVKQFKEILSRGEQIAATDIVCRAAPAVIARDVGADGEPTSERTLTWTISTPDIDRDGDTIAIDGWDIANFVKGGSVLWGHDYNAPVARPLATWVEGSSLKSRAQFMPREMNPFAHMVYEMAREGYVRSASVGFLPRAYVQNETRGGFMPMDFTEQELLEWSVVPVPSNPNALLGAKSKGIDIAPLGEWLERVLDVEGDNAPLIARAKAEKLWRIVRDVESVQVLETPEATAVAEPAPDEPDRFTALEQENTELRAQLEGLRARHSNMQDEPSAEGGEGPEQRSVAADQAPAPSPLETPAPVQQPALDKAALKDALREAIKSAVDQRMRYHTGRID